MMLPVTPSGKVEVVTMTLDELKTVVEWAAKESWNPGTFDAPCNYAADPEGFFIAKLDGVPVGSISAVRYDSRYGFMGFYLVLPECRGRGIGRLLWSAALRRLDSCVIGLDGVMPMVPCYEKSGFVTHHVNTRHRFKAEHRAIAPTVKRISSIPLAKILEFDRIYHPATRPSFLNEWVRIPGSHGFVSVEDGRVKGYGIARPSRAGWRIGPIFADNAGVAETILDALIGSVPSGDDLFMDVPGCNASACDLASRRGVEKLFETARMYKGPAPAIRWDGVYGVTSVELG